MIDGYLILTGINFPDWIMAIAALVGIPITIWGIQKSNNNKLEEQKLRLSIKPRLWLNGAGYKGYEGTLKIDLNNKGETAYLDDFILQSGDIILYDKSVPWELEKGDSRYIFGKCKNHIPIAECEYEIKILYHNALKQPYCAIIKGKGNRVKLIKDDPIK